jgi:hypothetical protein
MGLLSSVKKFFAVIEIAFHSKGGLRYISKKSASIASFNINNSLFNVTNNLKTVIDVVQMWDSLQSLQSSFIPMQ